MEIGRIPHALNENEFYFNGLSAMFYNENAHKIGVLGDRRVGKSTLVNYWLKDAAPVHENFLSFRVTLNVQVSGEYEMLLAIFDLSTSLDVVHSRPLFNYFGVILVCFSVDDRNSFENVSAHWAPEISELCENSHTILLAMKIDLRDDLHTIRRMAASNEIPVTMQEGRTLAMELGFKCYHECSVLTKEGLDDLFSNIADLILF